MIYPQVSTDEQTTWRQAQPGMQGFTAPATFSKVPALERAAFNELAYDTRPGAELIVSEPPYRLLSDILTVRAWHQAHRARLRMLSGSIAAVGLDTGDSAPTERRAYRTYARSIRMSTTGAGAGLAECGH